jgi:hypothetical protein
MSREELRLTVTIFFAGDVPNQKPGNKLFGGKLSLSSAN